jgi:excisionase family DNA binding protein
MTVAIKKLETAPVNRAPIIPADILTPEELADRLKVGVSWVYEKSRAGGKHGNRLPVLRCGRYLRFSWTDVCAWLRGQSA